MLEFLRISRQVSGSGSDGCRSLDPFAPMRKLQHGSYWAVKHLHGILKPREATSCLNSVDPSQSF